MHEIAMAILFGLPLAAVVLALGWIEVARLNGLATIAVAAIEADERVRLARLQAQNWPDGGAA